MQLLVLNTGSSSIRYHLFDAEALAVLASGRLEGIGTRSGSLLVRVPRAEGPPVTATTQLAAPDHRGGMERVIEALHRSRQLEDGSLLAIGHRAVHGGERFQRPVVVDAEVLRTLKELIHLAPLHNPPGVLGIEVALAVFPGVPQVAVFDTAFHRTLPPRAYRYAVPDELYRKDGVRRYGFHGTSHGYVARAAAAQLGRALSDLRLITLHLGNGASAAAIRGGESVDTSMGMTPLEGLVMGTRSGDLDPSVVIELVRAGRTPDELTRLLYHRSGLFGLCGASDMREVLRRAEAGEADAALAIDAYCYRVKKYVGAYLAVLGGLDALVFTAGVGENSPEVRARCCEGLDHLGIRLDPARNGAASTEARPIHAEGSPVAVLVVPTFEELEIARQARDTVLAAQAEAAAGPPPAPPP